MMLAYHELGNPGERDVYAISGASFREHVEIASRIQGTAPCITFDDGHISQYEVALPVLSDVAVPAMFFITTSWVGSRSSTMSWSQLAELRSAGHTIGSHSHSHELLTSCRDSALRQELSVSKRILEDRLGIEITTVSMPGGRVDHRVLTACAEAGYKKVFTSRVGEHRIATESDSEVIGRYMVTRVTSTRTVRAYLQDESTILCLLKLESRAKQLVKATLGDVLYQKLWRRAVRAQF